MSAAGISLQQASFSDFDAYSENLAGGDIKVTLPKIDKSQWSISQLLFSNSLCIQIGSEGSGSFAEGTTDSSCYNLFFSKHDSMGKFNGNLMGTGVVFLIQPGSEIHIIEKSSNGWMNILIPKNFAPNSIELASSESVSSGVKVLAQRSLISQNLWDLVSRYIDMATQTPSILSERLSVESFQGSILHGLSALFDYNSGTSYNSRGRKIVVNDRIISLALDFINDRLDTVISISDLAHHLGLPERTLRSGFSRYYGVSPSIYIQLRRLNLAHKLLRSTKNEETSVSEIAGQLGMWDFGRFAAR